MIVLNKEQLAKIETAFDIIGHTRNSHTDVADAAMESIRDTLQLAFKGLSFYIHVNWENQGAEETSFIMSVYPELSTVNKIIDALMNNQDGKVIKKLWESNKVWKIEIDGAIFTGRTLGFSFTSKELTAMILHEIGHVIETNSIPSRISTILRYEIAKSGYKAKGILGCNIFKSIMSLPVFDSCIADTDKTKSSIKNEIKADNYVRKCGYSKDLESALTKILNSKACKNNGTLNDKMIKDGEFSLSTIDDLRTRRDKLAKIKLLKLKESVTSKFMESVIDTIIEEIFEDNGNRQGWKEDFIHEKVEEAIDGYIMQEFFVFKSSLKRIENSELDYIDAKMKEMKTEEDKAILLSYITSKQDLVNYYISLLNAPKQSKYSVPHTREQLEYLKKKLLILRDMVLKYRLPIDTRVTYITWPNGPARALYVPQVDWPSGYEG